ncbi:hypothetical protein DdX_04028 [Ditylenchus destructor]|uniref:Uncharacterized protein n=1 Tax=Ditylenchus destructor TaxID=166010 RepID=A0AAD4RBR6_9BILA|nr:hypothetical protein DdX_04028 [Ditylenchus destructor]
MPETLCGHLLTVIYSRHVTATVFLLIDPNCCCFCSPSLLLLCLCESKSSRYRCGGFAPVMRRGYPCGRSIVIQTLSHCSVLTSHWIGVLSGNGEKERHSAVAGSGSGELM